MNDTRRILFITSARPRGWLGNDAETTSSRFREFVDQLNQRAVGVAGLSFALTTVDMLDVMVAGGKVSIYDRYTKRNLIDYDIVHLRNVTRYSDFSTAIVSYVKHAGGRVIGDQSPKTMRDGKVSQMVKFALAGLSVPDTWASWNGRDL